MCDGLSFFGAHKGEGKNFKSTAKTNTLYSNVSLVCQMKKRERADREWILLIRDFPTGRYLQTTRTGRTDGSVFKSSRLDVVVVGHTQMPNHVFEFLESERNILDHQPSVRDEH